MCFLVSTCLSFSVLSLRVWEIRPLQEKKASCFGISCLIHMSWVTSSIAELLLSVGPVKNSTVYPTTWALVSMFSPDTILIILILPENHWAHCWTVDILHFSCEPGISPKYTWAYEQILDHGLFFFLKKRQTSPPNYTKRNVICRCPPERHLHKQEDVILPITVAHHCLCYDNSMGTVWLSWGTNTGWLSLGTMLRLGEQPILPPWLH